KAEDGIRDRNVTGVQTCALPISLPTDIALRTIAVDGNIAFHPLSENITLGESMVIRRLNSWIVSKVSTMLTVLGVTLLNIAVEKDRKSTRLNSSHVSISYAVFCF